MARNSTEVSAEADVLLLFADGAMVPGEVKRTGAGVTTDEIAKLEALAIRLDAPWAFLAVGQPARDCEANVPAAESREAGNLRFVVTTDQVYEDYPIWSLGEDPFAWTPRSEADDQSRAGRFVSLLRDRSPDDPWSSQGSSLLADRRSDE